MYNRSVALSSDSFGHRLGTELLSKVNPEFHFPEVTGDCREALTLGMEQPEQYLTAYAFVPQDADKE